MGADADFARFIEGVRKLAINVRDDVAKEAAPVIDKIQRASAAAGVDPYGEPWRLRKDGQRAIPDAASAVSVVARGPLVVFRVIRGAAIQNYISPERRRQVIPDPRRPIPPPIVKALQEAAQRVFEKATD